MYVNSEVILSYVIPDMNRMTYFESKVFYQIIECYLEFKLMLSKKQG